MLEYKFIERLPVLANEDWNHFGVAVAPSDVGKPFSLPTQ
jgi:hypothetical protein